MPKRITHLDPLPAIDTTPISGVRGGQPATKASLAGAQKLQQTVRGHGRRILAHWQLAGSDKFLVPSTNPNGTASQNYPTQTATRILMRTRKRLTPGFALAVYVIYAPTGQTQYFLAEPSNQWFQDGAVGSVLVDVVWSNPSEADQDTSTDIALDPSMEMYGGVADPWSKIKVKLAGPIRCAGMVAEDPAWSEGTTVSISISARGGARPVDIVVSEIPDKYVRDDDLREATGQALWAQNIQYPYENAIVGKSLSSDPRHGPRMSVHNADSQRNVHGPAIMEWSTWNESTATVTVTEGTAVSVTATSFQDLRFSAITSHADSNPGWSMSSGGTARLVETSGDGAITNDGAIPVICRVYARMTNGAHSGTVRFQSKDYSLCDIPVSGSTFFWYESLAFLRCGKHQTDPSVLQLLGSVDGVGQTLQVRYASVEFGGHYELIQ